MGSILKISGFKSVSGNELLCKLETVNKIYISFLLNTYGRWRQICSCQGRFQQRYAYPTGWHHRLGDSVVKKRHGRDPPVSTQFVLASTLRLTTPPNTAWEELLRMGQDY